MSLVFAVLGKKTSSAFFIGLALVAVITCIGITMQMHVPWNNTLAEISLTDANTAEIWIEYSTRWTQWNHWRTLASCTSFIMMLVSVVGWNRD